MTDAKHKQATRKHSDPSFSILDLLNNGFCKLPALTGCKNNGSECFENLSMNGKTFYDIKSPPFVTSINSVQALSGACPERQSKGRRTAKGLFSILLATKGERQCA